MIVGAGSAGCVLANRLTADGRHSVLLLEAGPDDRPFSAFSRFALNSLIHIPVGFMVTMRHPATTWGFESEPVPGTNERRYDVIRGRVLGGSSSINAMLYVRGERQDYDHWRDDGCPGWGWDDVLPYFRRAEDHQVGSNAWEGRGGPLGITEGVMYPVMERLLDAAEQMGLPRASSFNAGTQFGGGKPKLTIYRGRRQSTAVAYLRPAMRRRNLAVITEAQVSRILFNGRNAEGVEYTRGGEVRQVTARAEVIISAGAIGSPLLLEMSGIGDTQHLTRLGVPVLFHAPGVGENLQDHYFTPLTWRLKPGVASINRLTRFPAIVGEALKYAFTRRGLLTSSAVQLFLYARSNPNIATADLQFSAMPASMARVSGAEASRTDPEPGMTFASCQLRPKSRGHVHARSRDARDAAIQLNYLSHPLDEATHIAGVRLARALVAHPIMRPYVDHEIAPGEEAGTNDEILRYVRATGDSVYHPVGTVRMGQDQRHPLDAQLRVRGVEKLRVIDASIMPTLVSGNTNSPTIMIAERASDMILGAVTATSSQIP